MTTSTVEALATAGLPLRTLCLNECLNVTDTVPLLDLLKGKAAGSLVELGLAQVPCVDNDVALVRAPPLSSFAFVGSSRPTSEEPKSSPITNSTGDLGAYTAFPASTTEPLDARAWEARGTQNRERYTQSRRRRD